MTTFTFVTKTVNCAAGTAVNLNLIDGTVTFNDGSGAKPIKQDFSSLVVNNTTSNLGYVQILRDKVAVAEDDGAFRLESNDRVRIDCKYPIVWISVLMPSGGKVELMLFQ